MDPLRHPEETEHNIDKECNFKTMFKSQEAIDHFYTSLEQTCFMKNSCEIDP
jgi:hypothetical protein